ncbi:MAG TPA: transglutaminase domain-containing protein [Anaerolineales bacterium]|nr:transglutaminase domain-containing protein [Anaerolineales bacterium]
MADLWTIILWSAAVLIAAMALPAANWTDDLGLIPVVAAIGLALGAVLVWSRFGGWAAAILALGYGAAFILYEMTSLLDPGMAWRDRVFDVAGRVEVFISKILASEPNHDTLMFVLLMSIAFWVVAVFGTWWLLRHGSLWLALFLPGLAVFLNVYYYRYGERLQIYLPVFLLAALALIVRTELTGRKTSWERLRAQVPSDISGRITQAGVVVALVVIALAWMWPSLPDAQAEGGLIADAPSYNPFGEVFSDALAGLRSPVNLYGETFADSLSLGAGADPGSKAIFQAAMRGEMTEGTRLYWRARTFDRYEAGGWTRTVGEVARYRPRDRAMADTEDRARVGVDVSISPFVPAVKLLYLPARADGVNRTVDVRQVEADGRVVDVLEVSSSEVILPGETYRAFSSVPAPTATELRIAGTEYPAWVTDAYLQLPEDVPESVLRLAAEIAGLAPNSYAKADAITTWLRENITYARVTEAPPPGRDPLEWFLFDSKVGYCDYYASSAVVMLRALGVPARFSVGYASGVFDEESNLYYVAASDTHSWPEVYFPGYGWVEFEPTASQPALVRPEGEGGAAETAPDTEDIGAQDDLGPIGAEEGGDDILRGLPEDVEVPEAPVSPFRWLPYAFLGLTAVVILILVTPARAVAARVTVAGSRRAGMSVPGWVEEWAAPPKTEAGRVFRRLAGWPSRLGVEFRRRDITPHERGAALAEVIPDQQQAIDRIVESYAAERYGDRPAERGEPSRAWRSLRGHLYWARVNKLIDDILGM